MSLLPLDWQQGLPAVLSAIAAGGSISLQVRNEPANLTRRASRDAPADSAVEAFTR